MPVDRALADGTTSSGVAPLAERRAIIDRCFAERSVEEVLAALDRERDDWAASVASSIRTKSPTSLKISLRELREGRQRAFDDCMRMEFRMVSRVMEGSDFFEGVRATIIEKDKTPAWRPATLAAVSNDDVNAYFAPLGENELRLGL
jgi:enoyl-CoA hydratase